MIGRWVDLVGPGLLGLLWPARSRLGVEACGLSEGFSHVFLKVGETA